MKHQSQSAFSLIELVTVILLIGILSAVAVPRLFQSTDKAHEAAIQAMNANLKSSLNLLRADWLLAGQPNPYQVDGLSIVMTNKGLPLRVFAGAESDLSDRFEKRGQFCLWVARNLAGLSSDFAIIAPDFNLEGTVYLNNQKWVVLITEAMNNDTDTSEGSCQMWYANSSYPYMIEYKNGNFRVASKEVVEPQIQAVINLAKRPE